MSRHSTTKMKEQCRAVALLRCCIDRIDILTRSHHPSSTPLDLASMPSQFPLEPLHLLVVVVEVVALSTSWSSSLMGCACRWAVRVVDGWMHHFWMVCVFGELYVWLLGGTCRRWGTRSVLHRRHYAVVCFNTWGLGLKYWKLAPLCGSAS